MTLSIKSILSCLLILATASDIHTSEIRESEKSQQFEVDLGKREAIPGEGVEPGQVPIVTYSYFSSPFAVTVYIQSKKKCNFGIPGSIGTDVDPQTIYQLAGNIIVFVWHASGDTTKISVLDMNKCANKNNINLKRDPSKTRVVVPFANGFDVFTSDNSRASYDADGKLKSQTSFPINSQTFDITAVSKGFYVIDHSHQRLKFFGNGARVVNVLRFNDVQAYSNNEQSLYSFCSFDIPPNEFVARCFQYDENSHEQWHNKVLLEFKGDRQKQLDVKNLAGGGVVFVAHTFQDSQLCFVKMGPKQVNIWKYSGKQTFKGAKLVDFSEQDRMVVLAYETTLVEQGSTERSIVSQKFSLIS